MRSWTACGIKLDFFTGDEYLEYLISLIEKQSKKELPEEILNTLEALLQDQKKRRNSPKVRLLNEKGKFEDIFENNQKG